MLAYMEERYHLDKYPMVQKMISMTALDDTHTKERNPVSNIEKKFRLKKES